LKVLGLAALGGVVAAGVVSERRRRAFRTYDGEELRARLHERLAAANAATLPGERGGATVNS
jgi:S1-C subfamily serine protease